MINTKFCRYKLLKILEKLSRNLDKTHRIKIQKEINSLVNYVKEEYNYDSELPRISYRFINDILIDLEDIDLLLGNIFVSESFDMPNDVKNEKKHLLILTKNLIDKYELSSKISVIKNRKTDIYSMLDMYAKNYGKERVIEALKTGLDIFLKQKSNIFSKKVNLTDENWQNFLKYVQEKYPIETIEKYLNKGLISNLVFETKNLKNIDTVKLIDLAQKLKKEGKYE